MAPSNVCPGGGFFKRGGGVLFSIQYPLNDARPFLEAHTHRLQAPFWGVAPEVGKEFIRNSGIVKHRRRGGLESWPGEEVYCNASRAVRFLSGLRGRPVGAFDHALSLTCAFRRFFSDGANVGRFEVGIKILPGKDEEDYLCIYPMFARDCLALLEACLAVPVKVPIGRGEYIRTQLGSCGRYLEDHFLRATTAYVDGNIAPTESWWLRAGQPLILIEYTVDEIDQLPKYARPVPIIEGLDTALSFYKIERGGRSISTWFLRMDPTKNGYQDLSAEEHNTLRRLRLNLFRIHAELECLTQMLKLVRDDKGDEDDEKKIQINARSATSQSLQRYFHDTLGLLHRKTRYGLEQSEILKAVLEAQYFFSPGERATLLARLSSMDFRPNLQRKIEAFTKPGPDTEGWGYALGDEPKVIKIENFEGVIHIGNRIEIGDNVMFMKDFIVANDIQNSYNKTAASDATPELKKQLEALTKTIAQLCKNLPQDDARAAARDLGSLTKEALSESPRQKQYKLSAEGLIEAAKSVAEFARPVATAVKAILALLA